MRNEFQERFTRLHFESGLTFGELSNIVKISPATLAKYEEGDAVPRADSLCRLCDYFGVSADYLLGRADE